MVRPASDGAIRLIVVGAVFQTLALIAFGLRIWSRRLKHRALDASDWLILASSIITLILSLLLFVGAVIGGAGYHQFDLTTTTNGGSSSLNNAAKIVFVAELMWLTINCLTKLSTLAFYNVMFRLSNFRKVTWLLMALTVAMYLAFFLKDFLICLPVQRNWSFDNPNDYCGVTTAGALATGIGITVMDAIIVIAPMPMFFRLQMPPMKKLLVCGIFSLGLVVCIISALRLNSVMRLDHADLTYTIIDLGIFTLLEPLLGITACCLPTIHPVLIHLSKSPLLDWTRRGSRSRKASSSGKRYNGTGGSTTLRGTQGSRVQNSNSTKNFDRLYNHLYPMTTTTITETGTRAHEDEEQGHGIGGPQSWANGSHGGISVTKGFSVDSVHLETGLFDKPLPSVPEAVSDLDVEVGQVGRKDQSRGGRTPNSMSEPVSPLSAEGSRGF